MTSTIDTLAKMVRHQMFVRVTCPACRRVTDYSAIALGQRYGFGRDPRRLKFRCLGCAPRGVVSIMEPERRADPPRSKSPNTPGGEPGKKASTTLAGRIARHEQIGFYCYDTFCGYHEMLDPQKLAEKLGPDHGAMSFDLLPRLTPCPKCRNRSGKGAGIRIHPDYDFLREKFANAKARRSG